MGFLLKLVKQIFELPDDFIMVIVQKNTVNKTDHHITRQFCGIQIFVPIQRLAAGRWESQHIEARIPDL